MDIKTVLVTGIGGNVGQGVLRNIRDIDKEICIIGTNINCFSAGNYLCDFTYIVPFAYEPNFIKEIGKIVNLHKVDLIIPTTDYEVFYLTAHKNSLNTEVVASDIDSAKIYLDKYLTYLHHSRFNIDFAKSWLPSEYKNEETSIILKPREGRGSRGIVLNPDNPSDFTDDYIIQPFYEGKEITTAFYIKKDGTLHGLFTMERELTNGTTSKSKTTKIFDADLEKIILKMIENANLRGSINIQSIVLKNGSIIPFEVNCRISGTNSIRHNLGFQDVKYTIQEYLYKEEPDEVKVIQGIATRLLIDVIYPNCSNELELNNRKSYFKIY